MPLAYLDTSRRCELPPPLLFLGRPSFSTDIAAAAGAGFTVVGDSHANGDAADLASERLWRVDEVVVISRLADLPRWFLRELLASEANIVEVEVRSEKRSMTNSVSRKCLSTTLIWVEVVDRAASAHIGFDIEK